MTGDLGEWAGLGRDSRFAKITRKAFSPSLRPPLSASLRLLRQPTTTATTATAIITTTTSRTTATITISRTITTITTTTSTTTATTPGNLHSCGVSPYWPGGACRERAGPFAFFGFCAGIFLVTVRNWTSYTHHGFV